MLPSLHKDVQTLKNLRETSFGEVSTHYCDASFAYFGLHLEI